MDVLINKSPVIIIKKDVLFEKRLALLKETITFMILKCYTFYHGKNMPFVKQ